MPLDPPRRYRDLIASGDSADRLRSGDLDRRVYGVRAPTHAADELASRCRMFAARLDPGVFFSHLTAARLHEIPLPSRLRDASDLHVTSAAPRRAPHAEHLIGHSRRVVDGDVVDLEGLRVSSPERTWLEIARHLDRGSLIAAGDALIHRWHGRISLARLEDRMRVDDRLARHRVLRAALPLLDPRAESPQESLLRVILHDGGLPVVDVNFPVTLPDRGPGIRVDLGYPALRIAIEYQGDYHRDPRQWRADMTRRSRLEAHGWIVIELNADDLRNPSALCDRIRRVVAARGRR